MNEWYPIPTQYTRANQSDIIRNLRQYLKNPIGATLTLVSKPDAFEQTETRILRNDLHYELGAVSQDTRLVLEAAWTVDGSTEKAQAIIEFKVSDTFLEWYWFPPVDVFVDADGNFSGTIVSGIDENLNNSSGATVSYTIASKSTSIASASLNADNDLSISVTGLTANTSGHVVVRATATIDGVERPVEQQIDINLIVNTVDLENYVTLPAISDFITAGERAGNRG